MHDDVFKQVLGLLHKLRVQTDTVAAHPRLFAQIGIEEGLGGATGREGTIGTREEGIEERAAEERGDEVSVLVRLAIGARDAARVSAAVRPHCPKVEGLRG